MVGYLVNDLTFSDLQGPDSAIIAHFEQNSSENRYKHPRSVLSNWDLKKTRRVVKKRKTNSRTEPFEP